MFAAAECATQASLSVEVIDRVLVEVHRQTFVTAEAREDGDRVVSAMKLHTPNERGGLGHQVFAVVFVSGH